MPFYVVKGRRAIRTIERTTITVEAKNPGGAQVKGLAMMKESDCEWEHADGPTASDPQIEEVEILANGDEEIAEK